MGVSFNSTRNQELILAAAKRRGYEAPHLQCNIELQESGHSGGVAGSVAVELNIGGLWIQNLHQKTRPLAFVRYRFFDLGKVMEKVECFGNSIAFIIIFDSSSSKRLKSPDIYQVLVSPGHVIFIKC